MPLSDIEHPSNTKIRIATETAINKTINMRIRSPRRLGFDIDGQHHPAFHFTPNPVNFL